MRLVRVLAANSLWPASASALCFAVLFAVPLHSQSAAKNPANQNTPAQNSADARPPVLDPKKGLFDLDFVVTDAAGKPVPGLGIADFTLLDNGQPVKIRSLHTSDEKPPDAKSLDAKSPDTKPSDPQATDAKQTDARSKDGKPGDQGSSKTAPAAPAELILLIDALNLTPQQIPIAEHEAEKFLRENGGHLAQPTMLYRLAETGLSGTLEASTDGNALATLIAHPGKLSPVMLVGQNQGAANLQLSNGQKIVNSREFSLAMLSLLTVMERPRPGRKLFVWVGSGWRVEKGSFDGDPMDEIVEYSTRLREARITLYRVTSWPPLDLNFHYQKFLEGVRVNQPVDLGDMSLEVLATQSGGLVPEPTPDLAAAIGRCLDDAHSFYTLSFDPPRTDKVDDYHALTLQASAPGLTLRTRTGYYDEPAYYDQPNPALTRVTVEQLEQALTKAAGRSDNDVAQLLSTMELTQRLNSTRLASWSTRMPGDKARAELLIVADASAFLDLPPAEIPNLPQPDQPTRRQMLSKTIDYLTDTIPELPNFYATRTTILHEESSTKDASTWKTAGGDRMLHRASLSTDTIHYRNGNEVADEKKAKKDDRSLMTKGTFGPILETILVDVTHGFLGWSHWEQDAAGPRAVFQYIVPENQSHYQVAHCCLTSGDGSVDFQRTTGYHGKIAIDPLTGAVLRLTVEADLQPKLPPNLPLIRSDILVEYGPVKIGDGTYICPLRSVSISRGRTVMNLLGWGGGLHVYGPFKTVMGDVSFGTYHMFGSHVRLIEAADPPVPSPSSPPSTASPAEQTSGAVPAPNSMHDPVPDPDANPALAPNSAPPATPK